MKMVSSCIIYVVLTFCFVCEVFSAETTCPVPPSEKLTPELITSKIEYCIQKREQNQESSITEFACPSGNFTYKDGRSITLNTLPHHVAVSLLFGEIDRDALSYMCDLRELREKDPVKWTEDARKKIEFTSNETVQSFAVRYNEVCKVDYIIGRLNGGQKKWVISTETFPQSICDEMVVKKEGYWKNMADILMSEGVAKGWKNDKDTWMNKVKGKYKIVADKFSEYGRIAARAINGLPALAKKTSPSQ